MRSIALLTTSLGILLHTLLGWCPQHVGCATGATACSTTRVQHHRCKNHHHATELVRPVSTTEHGQVPVDSDSHSCDHADCLFFSQAESIHDLAPLTAGEYLPLLVHDQVCAVEQAELRDHALRHFLPYSQGQAARIARGVWLI